MQYKFGVLGLNPDASVFVPRTALKDIDEVIQPVLIHKVFQYFPQNMTLPPRGISFDKHLCNAIIDKYSWFNIPLPLFEYMVQSRMIYIEK